MPTRPAKVQFATFTTPDVAFNPEHEANVPPEALRVIVVDAVVTTLPAESSTFTTGWVERVVPEAPEPGCVVKTNLVAAPKVTVKVVLVMEEKPVALALSVKLVPTRPAKVQPATFTTPELVLSPEHEANVPPEALSVMVVEAFVTTLPAESSTFTTGWVARVVPEAPPTGCVVKTNLLTAPKVEGEKFELVAPVRPVALALRV